MRAKDTCRTIHAWCATLYWSTSLPPSPDTHIAPGAPFCPHPTTTPPPGCEAPYVDPKTHLRYANTESFRIARSLTDDEVQARLGIRNAQSVLK
jgi:hypothetical protein